MFMENQAADPAVHALCITIAKRCVWVIPAVLREEERGLAFNEFYRVCREEIDKKPSRDAGRKMDFDNGVLEIHHEHRKGAKNDHRVLITTYQSQAADERKFAKALMETGSEAEASAKRTFKPTSLARTRTPESVIWARQE